MNGSSIEVPITPAMMDVQFSSMIKSVEYFMKASGQTINDTPTIVSFQDAVLRAKLTAEENNETLEAWEDENKVEILDGLCDQLYVLLGSILTYGMQDIFIKAFARVCDNNNSKAVDGKVIRNDEGKILKPDGFVPVDLSDLIK